MLLTLRDSGLTALTAPVGSDFYKGPINLNVSSAHQFFLCNTEEFVAQNLHLRSYGRSKTVTDMTG